MGVLQGVKAMKTILFGLIGGLTGGVLAHLGASWRTWEFWVVMGCLCADIVISRYME